MEIDLFKHFLPEGLMEHFTIESIEELGDIKTKKMVFYISLQEKNRLDSIFNSDNYESKGFYEPKEVQDFPIRGKAVYLLIKRRRWRLKDNSNVVVCNDYSFVADGSKLTTELSAFLKSTGRDPRRYDK